MRPARWWMLMARAHSAADARCGRAWVCGCSACRTARNNGFIRHRQSPRWWLDPKWSEDAKTAQLAERD